jgi:uncharacterized protein (TIGR02996 family)
VPPECIDHPEGIALVRAAGAEPSDPTPRLALADWLQEHGEEDFAQTIHESHEERDCIRLPDRVCRRWKPINACFRGWPAIEPPTVKRLELAAGSPWATALYWLGSSVKPAELALLSALPNLVAIDMSGSFAPNSAFQHLRGLKRLAILNADDAEITDDGVAALSTIKTLRELDLGNYCDESEITDAGVQELAALTKLTHLNLARSRITDTGARALAALTELRELILLRTAITDAGVKHLATLKNLTLLNLYKTRVTKTAAAKLRKALPGCEIRR